MISHAFQQEEYGDWLSAKQNFERRYLNQLLSQCNGNFSKASKISGITRENLYNKCAKLGIDYKQFRTRNNLQKETKETTA